MGKSGKTAGPAAGEAKEKPQAGALNPAALTAAQLARLLKAAGSKLATAAGVEALVERGLPRNADGTFHVVQVTAWLAKEHG